MKIRLHKLLYYTLLLGVYGIFFSVESFYNFEGHSDVRETFRYASVSNGPQKDVAAVRNSPLHSTYLHSLRLNKRFHQENIPSCPILTPSLPEYVLTPLVLGSSYRTPLPEPELLHRPLRGPPALA